MWATGWWLYRVGTNFTTQQNYDFGDGFGITTVYNWYLFSHLFIQVYSYILVNTDTYYPVYTD